MRRAQRQAELAKYALPPRTVRRGTRSDLEDDFLWRRERLVVETDFYGTHRGEVSFEEDRKRDMDLRRQGCTVHRYTGAQLTGHPAEIAGELGEILS